MIVLLAVFKQNLPVSSTIATIIAMIVLMVVTINFYAKKRLNDQRKNLQSIPQQEA